MPRFENPLAEVLRGAFREWGSRHKDYRKVYKKLTPPCFQFADIALGELDILAPGPLWTWYTRHHMRFVKLKNEDLRLTMELLQVFLADYAHGRLKKQNATTDKKERGPNNTTTGQDRPKGGWTKAD